MCRQFIRAKDIRKECRLLKIYFDAEEQIPENLLDAIYSAGAFCELSEGFEEDDCEISVSFVPEEEIRRLNKEFRGIDRVTDVLSFPQYEERADMHGAVAGIGFVELGDVVICTKRAEEQAVEYGHSFDREFIYLFVHSVMHLFGYDHMEAEEKSVMRDREEEIMRRLGIGRE